MPAVTTAPIERLQIVRVPQPRRSPAFADDVRAGLTARRKSLNSKYFYDAVGSVLFDAITLLPEYYLTRAETEILQQWGWEIVRALGNPVEFVELGSGSATKTRILIEEALRVQRDLVYSPIDISAEALAASAGSLVESYPEVRVTGYAGDYLGLLETPLLERSGKVLMMFMGSNIGNYEPAEATALLRRIAASLKPGDGLLLGADLKKKRRDLILAYDDPAGVTAAFNRNILVRINHELSADFDLDRFKHVVEYDRSSGCVRSYLRSMARQTVSIEKAGRLKVKFKRGECIHTESAYKYSESIIAKMAREANLRVERAWTDPAKRFSVNLLVPIS